jgi:hypothetical protein
MSDVWLLTSTTKQANTKNRNSTEFYNETKDCCDQTLFIIIIELSIFVPPLLMSLRNRDTRYFLLLAVVFTLGLYANTFSSGYVWDDRAAIVGNPDVHHGTPLWDLFRHDFWGQDITDVASHKSYRPLTVLSYRLNFYLTALAPFGFHVGNVMIYIATVCMFHLVSLRWISVEGSRVATLLFAAHPVHCEAVSSLVGRADCLSGLFFITALLFYSDALGRLRVSPPPTSSFQNTSVIWSNFLMAFIFGFAASLSKEIGLTIFGVFVVFEVLYVSSLSHKLSKHFLKDIVELNIDKSVNEEVKQYMLACDEHTRWVYLITKHECSNRKPLRHYLFEEITTMKNNLSVPHLLSMISSAPSMCLVTLNYLQHIWIPQGSRTGSSGENNEEDISPSHMTTSPKHKRHKSFRECFLWFMKFPAGTYFRIFLHVACLVCILLFRSHLHGDTQLYTWTIMENPISLEPHFLTRVLSYSHTHFLMLLKLFNPITPHLCFDYGHYCLPIITSVWERVNILSIVAYGSVLYWILDALLLAQRSSLLAVSLFLLPLVPALNILFPIGTTLAERLLFVPSMGVSILVGECFVHSLVFIWEPLSNHWAKVAVQKNILRTETVSTFAARHVGGLSKLVMYTTLLPILGIMSYRVIDRNTEWKDEFSIYNSALQVCPSNYKALTNTGMLLLNQDKKANAKDAAELSDR